MEVIAGVPRALIIETAEEVMKRFMTLPKDIRPKRTGGFLALMLKNPSYFPMVVEIGQCIPEFLIKSQEYTQEKCRRLYQMEKSKGHITSHQSRDPDNYKYGGAITPGEKSHGFEIGRNIIGALSGLAEPEDEAFITNLFFIFRWIHVPDFKNIYAISNNQLMGPLYDTCGDLFEKEYIKEEYWVT